MSLRRVDAVTQTGGEHDCVGAGDTSQADECCFANSAPCAGPICGANSWPYGITLQLVPESKFDLASHGPRAVSVRAVCAMLGASSSALRQRFRRALHGTRVRESKTVSLSSRTFSDSDLHTSRIKQSKTVRAEHQVLPRRLSVSRETRKYFIHHANGCPGSAHR